MFTTQTITATRQWFADNSRDCILEVTSGEVKVNDVAGYIAWREEEAVNALAGLGDHTFTFKQRAHYIQSGECVALLA